MISHWNAAEARPRKNGGPARGSGGWHNSWVTQACHAYVLSELGIGERSIARFEGEGNNQRGVLIEKEVLMLSKRSMALAAALTVLPQIVFAADAGRCVDVA